ncbi:hypothetical protein NPIL_329301 [Nephila pilipes]|uniref:Uncharacterized protein n=1 Tax=Nephila pilipes TaxID=299642 RepID=A0A8X6Q8B5_NEPPI|nr:hypothetical protein NPIL_329301 [Nephila pilipes]
MSGRSWLALTSLLVTEISRDFRWLGIYGNMGDNEVVVCYWEAGTEFINHIGKISYIFANWCFKEAKENLRYETEVVYILLMCLNGAGSKRRKENVLDK